MYRVLDSVALLGELHAPDMLGKGSCHFHIVPGGQDGQMGNMGDRTHTDQAGPIFLFHNQQLLLAGT